MRAPITRVTAWTAARIEAGCGNERADGRIDVRSEIMLRI